MGISPHKLSLRGYIFVTIYVDIKFVQSFKIHFFNVNIYKINNVYDLNNFARNSICSIVVITIVTTIVIVIVTALYRHVGHRMTFTC